MSEESLEAPEPDIAEQRAAMAPAEDPEEGDDTPEVADVPLETDPADRAEQARTVPASDEEDYR